MTPEEKSVSITKKFGYAAGTYINDLVLGIAKRSALVHCNEILTMIPFLTLPEEQYKAMEQYWQQVKTHIQSL
jgi:hypothetical protein